MKKIIFLVAMVTMINPMVAQDIHFTMFHVSPTLVNPASTGMFEGNLRASLIYKSQWASISKSFKTFSCAVDGLALKNKNKKSLLGVGLNVFRDVAGSSGFGTTKLRLTLSGILHLNDFHTAAVGLAGGWGQTSMQPDNLQWDSQFNGQVFDPSAPSNESYIFQNKQYFDFSAGAIWTYGKPAATLSSFDKFNAQVGAAMHHISKPEFANNPTNSERLYSRFALHANFQFSPGRNSKIALLPRFQAFIQGPSLEVNTGLMIAYLLQDGSKYTKNKGGAAINFGCYYRVGDSFSPSVEVEFGKITLGYAFDSNLSGLTKATNGRGGSEIYFKIQNPNKFLRFSRKRSFI